jgi:predicted esterase
VVAGFSQGGALTLALTAYHSRHFTGAVPIAGTLYAGMPAPQRAAADFQVLGFHGRDDRRIAYDDGARTIKTLQVAGIRAFLTGFPGVGHAIPEVMRVQVHAALRELLDQAQASVAPKRVAQPQK